MFRKIIGTIGARVINAFFGLLLVTINSNYLGAQGVGIISLIILGITIFLLINNFIGGAALIYLAPRIRTINLIIPSYLWAVLTAFIFYGVLQLIPIVPEEYNIHVVALGFLQSIGTIHLHILLGNKKIKLFNIITTIQVVVTTVFVFCFYYFKHGLVLYFVVALYISYLFTCICSIAFTLPHVSFSKPFRLIVTVRRILKYGGYTQFANILQLFNYRLSYYLIEAFLGKAALGKFSVGTQLSESVLLISRSISTVQYAHISNLKNLKESQELTLALTKATFVITVLLFSILLILPGSIYTTIFGKDFSEVSVILLCLFGGIIALSVTNIMSHYFSGIGKHFVNSISAGIGFVAIATFSFILIPKYHLVGAGIATSMSYLISSIFSVIYFLFSEKIPISQLMISSKDLELLRGRITSFFR